jgi:hypothetical protein
MRVFARTSVRLSVFSAAALLFCTLSANAGVIPITVVNGGFESLTTNGKSGEIGGTQNVTGWTSTGYNFVFSSDSAVNNTGAYTSNSNSIGLWAKNTDGTSNGIGASPLGGNFLAMDGAYQTGPISQGITGLTVGMDTRISFYYAGAQQSGFTGITTEAFQVSLGSQTFTTATLTDASHGFTGWTYVTMDFVPTSTTETLSFLAVGTPTGEPPFSLLDGISVVQVTPEPSSLALLGTGVLAIGGMLRRRRSSL